MSILIVGDSQFTAYLQNSLSNQHLDANITSCLTQAKELLQEKPYRVVVCSMPYQNFTNGENLLNYFKETSPKSKIIFITEEIGMNKALNLVKKGLFTCVKKPFLIEDLTTQINDALSGNGEDYKIPITGKSIPDLKKYVKGTSKEAQIFYSQIQLVAPTNFNVIIYGETGTGKESVAQRMVATRGDDSPFVAVDCGCLSKELAASELFGHEKGAFTGANYSKKGAFEQAHNGTLFLDEIGNLDYEIQTYLLRAIQERKIKKVGGSKEINVSVRIVVASNENLIEKVSKGEFREDLYHRLNEFEIEIPPLRERIQDLNLFIDHFVREGSSELNKNILGVNDEAFEILKSYSWPGNIRELKNTIRRACLLTKDGAQISKKELPQDLIISQNFLQTNNFEPEFEAVDYKNPSYLKRMIEKTEFEQIMNVLRKVNYNKTKAAVMLNIDRKTLYNKLKRSQ